MSSKKIKFTQDDIEFVYNLLRRGTIKWTGRAECLKLARKKVFVRYAKNGKPVYKYHWQCAHCKQWLRNQDDMEVDHIVEIGGVTAFCGDWNVMIDKILPRPVNKRLQALCKWCHLKKTKKFTSAIHKYKRK